MQTLDAPVAATHGRSFYVLDGLGADRRPPGNVDVQPDPEGKREGDIPGYHCWAEFYLDGVGWVPVDASEASKFPAKRDYFFGGGSVYRALKRELIGDPARDAARAADPRHRRPRAGEPAGRA
jgi:hypothetical protein